MTYDQMIEVITACRDGAEIEIRPGDSNLPWRTWGGTEFNFASFDYRVAVAAPVLRPHWPAVVAGDGGMFLTANLFATDDGAVRTLTDTGWTFLRLATEYPAVML